MASLLSFYFITMILSLLIGSVKISITEAISLLFNLSTNEIHKTIILDLRLPRILLALFAGGALSTSGLILQSLFRNPLVEPYTLGISGGASLGICTCLFFKLHIVFSMFLPLFGFAGAFLSMFFLYVLSLKNAFLKTEKLLLGGVMISFMCSSFIMLIMAVAKIEDLHGIIYWMMGSLSETKNEYIILLGIVCIFSVTISYFFSNEMNAFLLGEEEAYHLGISVEKVKKILFLITSLLTGVTVSLTGIIGFVGLTVPHITKRYFGYDHRITIPASFMLGGIFLIICDTFARTLLSPLELPVGVITGIIGGSIFIYSLLKANSESLINA